MKGSGHPHAVATLPPGQNPLCPLNRKLNGLQSWHGLMYCLLSWVGPRSDMVGCTNYWPEYNQFMQRLIYLLSSFTKMVTGLPDSEIEILREPIILSLRVFKWKKRKSLRKIQDWSWEFQSVSHCLHTCVSLKIITLYLCYEDFTYKIWWWYAIGVSCLRHEEINIKVKTPV